MHGGLPVVHAGGVERPGIGEDEQRPGRLQQVERSAPARPGRTGSRRQQARPARARRGAGRGRSRRPRRRGAPARAAKGRPMKPWPTTSTRPCGTRSAPRRTQASGSPIVARAASSPSGRSTQPSVRTRSGEPARPDRARPEAAPPSTSWPAWRRAHSPAGRWCTPARRGRPPISAATSCPSTVPAGALFRASRSDPQRPQATTRASVPAPSARQCPSSRGCPCSSGARRRAARLLVGRWQSSSTRRHDK